MRFFQPREYVSIDFSRQDVVVVRVEPAGPGERPITVPHKLEPKRKEPLKEEICSFLERVRTREAPVVNAASGTRALELARLIVERIQEHNRGVKL
jgi:hypothetical protein